MQCKYNICPCDDDVPAIDPNWYESSQFFFQYFPLLQFPLCRNRRFYRTYLFCQAFPPNINKYLLSVIKIGADHEQKPICMHACVRKTNKRLSKTYDYPIDRDFRHNVHRYFMREKILAWFRHDYVMCVCSPLAHVWLKHTHSTHSPNAINKQAKPTKMQISNCKY